MKMLLKFTVVVLVVFLSHENFAEDEAPIEATAAEVVVDESPDVTVEDAPEITVEAGYMRCTMDRNQWGYSSRCDCPVGHTYLQKIGQCVERHGGGGGSSLGVKPSTTRCTKDFNQWGHSSNCSCSSEEYEYDERIGRCVAERQEFVKNEESRHSRERRHIESDMEGCDGGTFSHDRRTLTCPDGSVYEKSTSVFEGISRHLAESGEIDALNTTDAIEGVETFEGSASVER